MPHQQKTLFATTLVAALLGLSACDREDPIVTYSAPKEARPAGSGMTAQAPAATTPSWTLPEGWSVAPNTVQMRFATISVPPDLQLAIMVLPPQDLVENVNRWEDQVSLPPTPAEKIDSVVRHMDGDHGTHFDVVDLTGKKKSDGTPSRMLAALLNIGGRSWSFKLDGAPEKIEPQAANFNAFLKSVHFEGAGAHTHDHGTTAAAPNPAPAASAGSAQSYALADLSSLPSGWRQDPIPRPMREATIFIGETNPATEVVISKFSMRFDLPMNLNRWRQQVGLEAASPEEMARYVPRSFKVGGHEGKLFDVVGPSLRQIVVMANVGGELWFVKVLGPKQTVDQHQSAFEAFTQALRFEPAQ